MKNSKLILLTLLFVFGFTFAKGQSYFSNINKRSDEVKAALAAGNPAIVKSKAQALTLALSAHQNITASQRKIYGSYIVKLMEEARHISEVTNLAHQQEHYTLFVKYWSEAKAKMKI